MPDSRLPCSSATLPSRTKNCSKGEAGQGGVTGRGVLVTLGWSKVHTPWAGAPYLQLQPGQQADIMHRTLGLLIDDLDPVWSGGAQGGSQGLISQPQVPCSPACFAGRPGSGASVTP